MCFVTETRNVEAAPPADTCPNGAVPWHIPPDMCSPTLSDGNRSSGSLRWTDKSGSFQSYRSAFSVRASGQETLGELPNSTIHIYIAHNQLFISEPLRCPHTSVPNKAGQPGRADSSAFRK